MLLIVFIFTVKSSYYIAIGYNVEKYKCNTRDELVDRINSMDLSFQRLPTITIDEDLELDCNELPMFYYKVATLHRDNTFPTYSFISNKTNGFANFTLDTTTNLEDNCPGFSFTNITVIFKGKSLNTSKFSIASGVNIVSDPGFQLHTTISEVPLNFLSIFPGLSFCRLSILPEVNSNFIYPAKIELQLQMKYAEAYMFSIDIDRTTDVFFEPGFMYVNLVNKTKIVVHLPEVINYSNAFYFNIKSSNIWLTFGGDISYTSMYPHYFFINQDFENSINVNITFNPGNYFSNEGTFFNIVTGEKLSLYLFIATVFWNNPTPIMSAVLSYVDLHLISEMNFATSNVFSKAFGYYGESPIHGNLSIQCGSLAIPYHTDPSDGCFINITTKHTADYVDYSGDLYVTSSITMSVDVTNLHFVGNPLISLGNRNLIKAKTVTGKARIAPYTVGSAGTITSVMCIEEVDTLHLEDFTVESDYGDVFQPVIQNGCLCVNKTKSSDQSLTVTIVNQDDDWSKKYESFKRKLTITISTSNCELDFTVFVAPISIVLQAKVECKVAIKINQDAANWIESLQIGSSTIQMEVTWSSPISLSCGITIYKCCSLSLFFKEIDLSKVKSVTLKELSQLSEIEPFAKNIKMIIISTTAKVKNFTFTDYGWRYYTDDLPEDEEGEIKGFYHPNLLLPISSTNAFGQLFSRIINIGLETNNPFPLYISFSTNVNADLLGKDKWETVDFQPIILVSGTLTLQMQFEILPINFNDLKFEDYLNRAGTRKVIIHRTSDRIQSLISINSVFYLKYSCEISVLNIEKRLYLEVNKQAVVYKAATIIHSDSIYIVFRNILVMNNAAIQRMWTESNSIVMYNTSTLLSPSFLDEITIYWNCNEQNRNKPSMIENAHNTNLITFEFEDVSENSVSSDFEKFFNQPFPIANSVIDISCEELISKIAFVNDQKSFNFSNKIISFDVICKELIYSTHPVTFTLDGYQKSGYPSHIGLFLNRTMRDINAKDRDSKGKKGLDSVIIACIIIGILGLIIFASMSIYSFNRHKHSIYTLVDEI